MSKLAVCVLTALESVSLSVETRYLCQTDVCPARSWRTVLSRENLSRERADPIVDRLLYEPVSPFRSLDGASKGRWKVEGAGGRRGTLAAEGKSSKMETHPANLPTEDTDRRSPTCINQPYLTRIPASQKTTLAGPDPKAGTPFLI